MARPSDEDSGVLSLRELAPRFTNSGPAHRRPAEPAAPFWTSQMPVALPPNAQPPPVWSPTGQWSSPGWSAPLQPIEPPHYTPRPIGLRRPRRWGLRFFMFAGLVGLGAFLGRDHLPPFPRSLTEASAALDSIAASVRRAGSGLTGKTGLTATPLPVAAPQAPRGPQIVPLPSSGAPTAAPAPAVAVAPAAQSPAAADPVRSRSRVESLPPVATATRARLAAARPVRVAMVPGKAAPRRAARDPFEEEAAAAPVVARGEKPVRAPVVAAPREVLAPAPERAPAAAKAAPGSLDDLMNSVVKPAAPKAKSEIDRRLAGINETRDDESARKKVEAEPAPAPALGRTQIQAVMRGLQPKVSDCYREFGKGGPADVKVTVVESGSVSAVALSGPFAGTPTGTCVERAVKSASFPPSRGLRFDYRLTLR